MNPEERYQTHT